MSEEFQLKFKVTLGGGDAFDDFFQKSERKAADLQASLSKRFKAAGADITAIANKAKSAMNDFAGKELGGSIASNARGVLQYRDAVTQLAVSANKGESAVAGLNTLIQKTAKDTNQLQGDVTEALAAFVERSGNLQAATDNIAEYGRVATATGASLREVALVGEALSSKLGITQQAGAFAILVSQAKKGAIELRDIAKHGGSIFTAAGAANISKDDRGVAKIGGLLQIVAGGSRGQGKTSAADTAVMVAAMFSQIRQKAGKIEELGIKVDGRDYIDVARDLVKHFEGQGRGLGTIFKNDRAFRAVAVLAEQYKEDKKHGRSGFSELDKLTNITPNANFITEDFATRRKTGEAKLKAAEIAKNAFSEKLGGIAEFGAEHATELQLGAIGLGGLGKGLSFAGRFFGKGGAAAGGFGAAVANVAAQHVYVTGGYLDGIRNGMPTLGSPTAAKEGWVTGTAKAAWQYGKYAIPVAGAILAGTALVSAAGDREDLVKKLEDADKAMQLNARANADLRKNTLRRRSGGAVVSAPGQSLGSLDEAMKADIKNQITINIDDQGNANVEDNGTRSTEAIVRRGGRR